MNPTSPADHSQCRISWASAALMPLSYQAILVRKNCRPQQCIARCGHTRPTSPVYDLVCAESLYPCLFLDFLNNTTGWGKHILHALDREPKCRHHTLVSSRPLHRKENAQRDLSVVR